MENAFCHAECLDSWRMEVARSALRIGRLYPQEYSSHSYLLEAEPTPGSYCDRND
jgi:hypothetical protein